MDIAGTPTQLSTDNADLNKIFASLFSDQVNSQDVNAVLVSQEHILRRLDLTNSNLKNSVSLSSERYLAASKDFNSHVQTLTIIKKDLDHVFKKIRAIKAKLAKKYPEQYENASGMYSKKKGEDSDEDDYDELIAKHKGSSLASDTQTKQSPDQASASAMFDFSNIKNKVDGMFN